MNAGLAGAFAAVVAFFVSATASAAPPTGCGEKGQPWIRVRLDDAASTLRSELMAHIKASLAARNVDACVSDENVVGAPLSVLQVTTSDDSTRSSIVVDDAVTRKRVERELDLRGMPPDGRALTIALALDELLRASWAELLLPDAAPPAAPPPVVREAIRPPRASSPARSKRRVWGLGLAMAGDHFAEGQDQIGPDLMGSYMLTSRVGLHARLGWRSGFLVHAPRGEIRSTALLVSPGISVALFPRSEHVGIDLLGELLLARVTFTATASAARTRGNEASLPASYVIAASRLWVAIASGLAAFARVGAGAPLLTAYANDGDTRTTGLGGLMLTGELGCAWSF